MSSRKIINMILFFLFLLISYSCISPFDKKIADTNYKEVLNELQQKNLITKEEHVKIKEKIELIIIIKDDKGIVPKSVIHTVYGVPYEKLTYREVYNRWCLEEDSEPNQ